MAKNLTANVRTVTLSLLATFLFTLFAVSSATQAATLTVGPASSNQYSNLQTAINAAQPGDTLLLQAGATFTGPFVLPNKNTGSTQWITIRTSAADSNLPPAGQRITPAYVAFMAKIVSPGLGQPAILTQSGAHHYRLVGIEVTLQDPNAFVYNLVNLGSNGPDQDTLEEVPHHFVIDRCYIHGLPGVYLKRGIELNSSYTDIVNSYISEVHGVKQDAQAISGWNGPGPYKIVNNYLEGAGENILFGGVRPDIVNNVPSDIEIRRNHLFKPLSWRVGDPSYAGNHWTIKNLLQLKSARRVVIEDNILENSWLDEQVGFAVLFTVTAEAEWEVIENVWFTNNIVRHSASAIQLKSVVKQVGTSMSTVRPKQITIRNNLFEDIDGVKFCGADCSSGHFLSPDGGVDGLIVDHNTVFHTGNVTQASGKTSPTTGFVFTNNLMAHNAYGVHGGDSSSGYGTLNDYFPGWDFRGNLIAGANPNAYPMATNYYPPLLDDAGFVNRAAGDYRLAATSPYKNQGTDGKDIGCDIGALNAATSGSISGVWPVSNAVTDFSPTQNPNAGWSYGYQLSSFTLYDIFDLPVTGLQRWRGVAGDPGVLRNSTGALLAYLSILHPADLLNLHPGPNGESSVVRWTARRAGSFKIEGRFVGIDTVGTTTSVEIFSRTVSDPTRPPRVTKLFGGTIAGYGSTAPFSLTRSVVAGDILEFSVGTGGNGYAYDSTGLAVTITPQ